MKSLILPSLISLFAFHAISASAYEVENHEAMTLKAFEVSILGSVDFMDHFGISSTQLFTPRDPEDLTIVSGLDPVDAKGIMGYGSVAEDSGFRALNHFFDPQNLNRPISIFSTENSVNWTIEDPADISGQYFSLRDAWEQYYLGLTVSTPSLRTNQLGMMFQSLGHIVHHIQDMAQPQHVRHDAHCNHSFCFAVELASNSNIDLFQPSAYEEYSRISLNSQIESLFAGSYYSTVGGASYYAKGFTKPSDFWSKDNIGMATFVGENFVSIDTNFSSETGTSIQYLSQINLNPHQDFPKPDGSDIGYSIRNLSDPDLCGPACAGSGSIVFLTRNIFDHMINQYIFVEKFATLGMFDKALVAKGFKPLLSLNQYNYDDRYVPLIPRAISFSAGLIDHFFRGSVNLVSSNTSNLKFTLASNTGQTSSTIFNGTAALFYDDNNSARKPVSGASWIVNWSPPQGSIQKSFAYPTDANGNFVLVFNGTIDGETVVAGKHFTIEPSACEIAQNNPNLFPTNFDGIPALLEQKDDTDRHYFYKVYEKWRKYYIQNNTSSTLNLSSDHTVRGNYLNYERVNACPFDSCPIFANYRTTAATLIPPHVTDYVPWGANAACPTTISPLSARETPDYRITTGDATISVLTRYSRTRPDREYYSLECNDIEDAWVPSGTVFQIHYFNSSAKYRDFRVNVSNIEPGECRVFEFYTAEQRGY